MYSVLSDSNLSCLILPLTFVAQDIAGKYFKTLSNILHMCWELLSLINSIVFRRCLSDDTFRQFRLLLSFLLGEKSAEKNQEREFFHIRKEDEVFSVLTTKGGKTTLLIEDQVL